MSGFSKHVLVLALFAASGSALAQGEKGKEAPAPTAKQVEAIWADLIQNDDAGSKQALAGMRSLMAAPQLAVPFLKERLKPVPALDAKRIEKCLADLDDNNFMIRDAAAKELEAMGALAAPALERKLQEKLVLETQRRLEGLLEKMERHVLTAGELRTVRAIEVLHGIATPEAIALLRTLSKGADGAVTTVQAKRALANLTP